MTEKAVTSVAVPLVDGIAANLAFVLKCGKLNGVHNASDGSDVVSAVWYDETNKSLWYSYIENPLQNAGKRDKTGAVSTEWATPVPLLKGNAGESCAIATDEDGHIHIAAYSRSNAGSLYYIYLDKYNSSFNSSKNLVKIDSYGSTGQYITMEVAKDTLGCILVGKNNKKGWVSDSRFWTNKLIQTMKTAWDKKEKVTIVIQ